LYREADGETVNDAAPEVRRDAEMDADTETELRFRRLELRFELELEMEEVSGRPDLKKFGLADRGETGGDLKID
jgi:hypothetical protein